MQDITTQERALLDTDGLTRLYTTVNGADAPEIDHGTLTAAVSGGEFSVGNAISATFEAETGAEAAPSVGDAIEIDWSVDDTRYPLFRGTVEQVRISAGRAKITAYDAMYRAGSGLYTPAQALTEGSCDGWAVWQDIAGQMGTETDPEDEERLSAVLFPAGIGAIGTVSHAKAAGMVAMCIGGNARITRDGLLGVSLIKNTGDLVEIYSGGGQAGDGLYSPGGLTFVKTVVTQTVNEDGTISETETEETFSAGDGSLTVSNPLATQDIADKAWANLDGVSYHSGSYHIPEGLWLEPGDMVDIMTMDGTKPVYCGEMVYHIAAAVDTIITAPEAVSSGGAVGPVTQELQRIAAELAEFRRLVAENAEINSANITTLFTKDITVTGTFVFDNDKYYLSILDTGGIKLGAAVSGSGSAPSLSMGTGSITMSGKTEIDAGFDESAGTSAKISVGSGKTEISGPVEISYTQKTDKAEASRELVVGNGTVNATQLTIGGHASPVGTVVSSGDQTVSVASGTNVTVASITLTPGTWIISYHAAFAANSSGNRYAGVGSVSTSNKTVVAKPANSGIATTMEHASPLVVTAAGTYNLLVRQASGSTLSTTGIIEAVRIA